MSLDAEIQDRIIGSRRRIPGIAQFGGALASGGMAALSQVLRPFARGLESAAVGLAVVAVAISSADEAAMPDAQRRAG